MAAHQFTRVQQTQEPEGHDRQYHVATIDPIHLPVESRQACQFLPPVKLEWYEGRRHHYAEVGEAGGHQQAG